MTNLILRSLFSDIFDIYPSDYFISTFLKNDQILIDKILNNNYLQFSVIYGSLWNFIFKTYPTHKDQLDINHFLNIDTNSNIVFDLQLLEKLLNTFMILKLGLLNYLSLDLIKNEWIKLTDNVKNKDFMTEYLVEKIKYRFQNKNQLSSDNFILNIISIRNTSILYSSYEDGVNPVTGSYNESIILTPDDHSYMNLLEKNQYVIYKDHHFLLKFIDNITLYSDIQDVSKIVQSIEKSSKNTKKPLIFNTQCDDSRYSFNITDELYNLLPCISKQHITISHNTYPNIKSLSNDSIYYMCSPVIKTINKNIDYGKIIINDLDLFNIDISQQKYIIHNIHTQTYDFLAHDHIKIYCQCKLTRDLLTKNNNIEFIDDLNHQNIDIIIDYDKQISIPKFICNSLLIVNYDSPYLKHMINSIKIKKPSEVITYIDKIIYNKEILGILKKGIKTTALIFNPLFVETMWSLHLQYYCPIKTEIPSNNILLYLNFIHKYIIYKLEDIIALHLNTNTINSAIIIDNRANILSVISVLFTMSNLNDSWTCHIFTSKKNMEFYQNILGHCANIEHHPKLDIEKFHIDIYNDILMDTNLWTSLANYDKCLVFQDDGILLRKGIEQFIEYDYIGAPWINSPPNDYIKNNINPELVGNGGLSLRTIKIMQEITNTYHKDKKLLFFNALNNVPEDVYFSKYCKKLGAKLPSSSVASKFSSEEILNYKSIGLHKLWAYQHPKNVRLFFNNCLVD